MVSSIKITADSDVGVSPALAGDKDMTTTWSSSDPGTQVPHWLKVWWVDCMWRFCRILRDGYCELLFMFTNTLVAL